MGCGNSKDGGTTTSNAEPKPRLQAQVEPQKSEGEQTAVQTRSKSETEKATNHGDKITENSTERDVTGSQEHAVDVEKPVDLDPKPAELAPVSEDDKVSQSALEAEAALSHSNAQHVVVSVDARAEATETGKSADSEESAMNAAHMVDASTMDEATEPIPATPMDNVNTTNCKQIAEPESPNEQKENNVSSAPAEQSLAPENEDSAVPAECEAPVAVVAE